MHQTAKEPYDTLLKPRCGNSGLCVLLCFVVPLLVAGVYEWTLHKVNVPTVLGNWSLVFMLSLSLPGVVLISKLRLFLLVRVLFILTYMIVYSCIIGTISLIVGMLCLGL